MERYTQKDAREALNRLIEKLARKHTQFDHTPDDIGSWYLDCNATYGGCVINEVVNAGYGVRQLGNRMKPYEFCQAVNLYIAEFF